MNAINIAVGTKVQRKGSKVVWTMIPGRAGDDTTPLNYSNSEVHISCVPKNRTTTMQDWISVESLINNWSEV